MKRSLREIAEAVGARLQGDGSLQVRGVASISAASHDDLVFVEEEKYFSRALQSKAGAVITGEFAAGSTGKPLLISSHPKLIFARAARFLQDEGHDGQSGAIHATAIINPSARIAQGAMVGERAVIAADAEIGESTRIGAGCVIGQGVKIGRECSIFPSVTIYSGTTLGDRVIVHAGAVLGSDGFGYVRDAKSGRYEKFPQVGRLVIEEDVEIGANTTIDRGAIDDTVIEDDVKLDNQIQVGHNCRIGAHSAIAGCVGIAGSATIGRRCQLGGASMIQGHITIADDTIISGATAVTHDVREAGFYTGIYPFMRNREWERNAVLLRHLDELRERIRRLETQLRTRPTESDR